MSDEQLKGIGTPAEIARLSQLLATLSETISKGNLSIVHLVPRAEPNIQNDRITEGYTYYDRTTKKVRTWDGSAWKDHY